MNKSSLEMGERQHTMGRLLLGALLLAAVGCHTAEGVKQDTKSALDATGRGLQKGAEKIDGSSQSGPGQDGGKDSQPSK